MKLADTLSVAQDAGILQEQAQFINPVIVNYHSTPGNPHYKARFDLKLGCLTIRKWIIRTNQAGARVVLPPATRQSKGADHQWLQLVSIENRQIKASFDEAVLLAIDAYLAKQGTEEASNG